MATFLIYDSAYPLPAGQRPTTDGVLIYALGDTPHPWTVADIAGQPARYRLPCFVRSNPQQCDPHFDAAEMIAWLRSHDVPQRVATVLDLETSVDPGYVSAYGADLREAGWLVLPYGSMDSLFQNPMLDGYFVANPTGIKHVVEGCAATQWGWFDTYDLDDVLTSVPLWDTHPAPTPPLPPFPIPSEENEMTWLITCEGQPDLLLNGGRTFAIATPGDLGAMPGWGVEVKAWPVTLATYQQFAAARV